MPCALAFAPQKHHARSVHQQESRPKRTALDESSRRDFFDNVLHKTTILVGSSAAELSLPTSDDKACASGGATAGGAYLLSAKQRYNERVKAGVKGFVGIKSTLEAGDIPALREYFASEETGGWKDFMSAGYLLANGMFLYVVATGNDSSAFTNILVRNRSLSSQLYSCS